MISIYSGYDALDSPQSLVDYDGLVELLRAPKVGPKGGTFFVRGYVEGRKSDANVRSVDVLTIDGDRAEGYLNCCPFERAARAFGGLGIAGCIHTTHTHDPTKGVYKWRIIIPVEPGTVTADNLATATAEIHEALKEGTGIIPAGESHVLSQAWYLARVAGPGAEYSFAEHHGALYRPDLIIPGWSCRARKPDRDAHENSGAELDPVTMQDLIDDCRSGTQHRSLSRIVGVLQACGVPENVSRRLLLPVIHECQSDRAKAERAADELGKLYRHYASKQLTESWDAGSAPAEELSEYDRLLATYFVSRAELTEDDLRPPRWVIPGLLPEGLTLLSGRPKAGKSTLSAEIAAAICTGGYVIGERAVKGEVLQLDLENPLEQQVGSIKALFPPDQRDTLPGLTLLRIPDDAPMLDISKLGRLIDAHVAAHPGTVCVILDTMKKFLVPRAPQETEYDYWNRVLAPLQRWARKTGIAVLALHHNNKSDREDQSAVYGDTSLVGNVDTLMILHGGKDRPELGITLKIHGRRIKPLAIKLEYDDRFRVVTPDQEPGETTGHTVTRPAGMDSFVLGASHTAQTLADTEGISVQTAKKRLARLRERGLIVQVRRGEYIAAESTKS